MEVQEKKRGKQMDESKSGGSASNRQQQRPRNPPDPSVPGQIFQFKLVLLGEAAVGKSSLVLRFVKGHYYDHQESTIGAAFLTQSINLDNTTIKFEIWDTAGQERYHSLAPMYYRGAQASIVVYDITSAESFERAKTWVRELQRQASPNIIIALAGNKSDLGNKRQIDTEDGAKYASEHGLIFMETSAKTSQNVIEIFTAVARKLPKTTRNTDLRGPDVIRMTSTAEETTKKKKCC